MDYLILFHIGNWDEEKYFWKTAISVKHNDNKSFQQLVSLFSVFKNFAFQCTWKVFKGKCYLHPTSSIKSKYQ